MQNVKTLLLPYKVKIKVEHVPSDARAPCTKGVGGVQGPSAFESLIYRWPAASYSTCENRQRLHFRCLRKNHTVEVKLQVKHLTGCVADAGPVWTYPSQGTTTERDRWPYLRDEGLPRS